MKKVGKRGRSLPSRGLMCVVGLLLALQLTGCGTRDAPQPADQKATASKSAPDAEKPAPQRRGNKTPAQPLGTSPIESEMPAPIRPVKADPSPSVVYRRKFPRRELSAEELTQHGLTLIKSDQLRLVTDLKSEAFEPLLVITPQLTAALSNYFGPLPPAQDGATFELTGFVMGDREKFAKAKLLTAATLSEYHGRQIGAEFWMNNQSFDYYRSHLFAHEVTHAFMLHLPGASDELPQWYLEGMAELFGTHRREPDGRIIFGVMPGDAREFRGHERIELVRRNVVAKGLRSTRDIRRLSGEDFFQVESYAWSWALCRFLTAHPRYRDRFQQLGRELGTVNFDDWFERQLGADSAFLEAEWLLFAKHIKPGFDFERAAITFQTGNRKAVGNQSARIYALQGWQSSGVWVEPQQRFEITTSGTVTLAQTPKPWESEANGISIRYANGQPLGRLIACVRPDVDARTAAEAMLVEYPLGNRAVFASPVAGTVYLRVNDSWSELADNTGDFNVTFHPVE